MFRPADDIRYLRFLKEVHRRHVFDWYLEIGCRNGRSIAAVRSKTIAIDPYFRITSDVIGTKPALHVFQSTSDEVFASGVLDALNVTLGFAFLDGMHLFEYVLRDLINTERISTPGGVAALHDCCPASHEMTTRDLDNLPPGAWTGDVWKLIPILAKYRPDLEVTVLGCSPTGLVLVSGLDPANRVLEAAYDEIVAEWTNVTLEDYGTERFFGSFDYVPAQALLDRGLPQFRKARTDEDAAISPSFVSP